MEPWYKFILYGTYDGFSRSTLGDDNLYLILENGEKVEIPRCFVKMQVISLKKTNSN